MNPENIELKIAVKADAERISLLVNSVYRGENAKKGWTTEADLIDGTRTTAEKISEIIARDIEIIIIALLDNKIIGCVHLENKGSYSLLGMLSVDVNYQNKGIGRILIEECERYTKEVYRLNKIRMKVFGIRKELLEYYQRKGYAITGEQEIFTPADQTFGTPKQELYFEILTKQL